MAQVLPSITGKLNKFRICRTLLWVTCLLLSVVGASAQTSPLVRPIVTDQTALPLSNKFQPTTGKLNQSHDFVFLSNDGYALFLRKAGSPAPVRIIQRGDPVPGMAESRIENILGYGCCFFINSAGVVAFEARFTTLDSSGYGIFLYDGTGLHTLILSTDVAPRSNGAVFGNMSLIGFNDSGDIAFRSAAAGTVMNTYFILPAGGAPTRIAGPGDALPDGAGTITSFNFPDPSDRNALNALGEIVFVCSNSSNVWGIFAGSRSGLRKIVATGDAKPGTGTFTALYPEIWINSSGTVAFRDTSYTSGKSITTLWRNTPGVGTVRVVADGDAAPSELGRTLTSVKLQGLNDSGQVLFTAAQGVFRTKADLSIETVAYVGQAIPGGAGETFSSFTTPVINNSGDVAFGGKGATTAHLGVFEKAGTDPLKVLAFQGDSAGVGGGTLEFLNFYNFALTLPVKILDDAAVHIPADVIGGSSDFLHLLSTSSGLQTLMSGADSLPDGARVNLGTVQSGVGDYIGFLASRNGGRRTAFVHNVLTGATTAIATSGDPAPGTSGRLRLEHGYSVQPGSGALEFVNSKGQAALFSPIVGAPHPTPLDYTGFYKGVFLFDPEKGLQKIAAAGDTDAGTGLPIQGIYSDPDRRAGEHPLNANGQVVFSAFSSNGSFPTQSILVGSVDGGVKKVVIGSEGLPSSGSNRFYFASWSTYQHSTTPKINDAGQVAFSSGSDDVEAIYLWSPGAPVVKIAGIGDVIPSGEMIEVLSPFCFNENGQVLFSAKLRNWSGTSAGSATFIGSASSAPQPILSNAESVAGIQGASVHSWFEGSSYANWHGGYGAGVTYSAGLLNNAGTVVLPAQLIGGTADSGLFLKAGLGSSLTPVYLQGQSLPGTSGVFGTASPYYSGRVMLNDSGYVYVNNYPGASTDSQGLFRYRPDGVWEKVLATGDTVQDSGGKVARLGQIYQLPVSNPPFLATMVGGTAAEAIYVPLPLALQADTSSLSFTSVDGANPEPKSLTISNSGGSSLNWTATASESWITLTTTSGSTPGTIGVSVNASGLSQGVHHGTITITGGLAQNSPITVNITFRVQSSPSVTWSNPEAITYGTALSAKQLNATASASIPGTFVYTPEAGTVLGAGTHTLSVTFTPTDTDNYAAVTRTVSLTVNKATPSIQWAMPTAITYGTALTAAQLNATADIPGTFAYTPAAGAVLDAGARTLMVAFTPTDTTNYANASGTVQLTVNKATPSIHWAAPTAIAYGTALTAAQLNASADVPGTFAYSPAAGAVLDAGTRTLSVAFTPTDTTNYANASGTVQLTVNKATPVIHWAAPAAITSGTALGDAQLNATADIPGTFVYAPSKGTVPDVGAQTLSVRFTPTDTGNYTEATASVSLKVNAPEVLTPVITGLSPALVKAGSSGFSLVVSGTGFGSGATVMWNGSARTTTAVSGGLQAEITAADVASSETVNITVANPAGLGGVVSSRYQFVIDTAAVASSGFTVTVPTTVSIESGKDTQVPVALAGVSSGATVTATCVNVPVGVTCSYQNGVLTFTTSQNTPPGTYTITTIFSTTTQTAAIRRSGQGYFALWLGLGGLPFGLIWAGGVRKVIGRCGIVVAGLLLIVALASCGGGAAPGNPTTPTTPTTPVTRQSSVVMTLTVR